MSRCCNRYRGSMYLRPASRLVAMKLFEGLAAELRFSLPRSCGGRRQAQDGGQEDQAVVERV